MLVKMLVAAVLVAITVAVHAGGLGMVLWAIDRSRVTPPSHPAAVTWLLIRVIWLLILVHVAAITVWALFYWWRECLPSAEAAFYFSGVTYTTLGYGDLVLPEPWRMLGPVEGLSGILMSALSASLFFAIVSAIHSPRAAKSD
jgi:hypothetical protein